MKACRSASAIGGGVLLAWSVIVACRDEARPLVAPVTTAMPDGSASFASSTDEGASAMAGDASFSEGGATSARASRDEAPAPIEAAFVDVPGAIDAKTCSRVFVAVARGKVTTAGETLATGDLLVATVRDGSSAERFDLRGEGLTVVATEKLADCAASTATRAKVDKQIIRATTAPRLTWGFGAMSAHLDTNAKVSPTLYVGRLEGAGGVPEHTHAGSWEIIAAIEGSGTFTLDGIERRLGPKQIVMVPKGIAHAWRPDAGSKLVAIQMYAPPGPEQRFIALAASEKTKDAAQADGGRARP